MKMRRMQKQFALVALVCFVLAGIGHWVFHWPRMAVHILLGVGSGHLVGVGLFYLLPRWWRDHCDDMYAQPAGRRYITALWPIMLFYTVALLLSLWWIKQGIESLPLRALVAVLPALAIALLMRAALRYLREIDELQRRIETEAIGIASLLIALLYFAGGLLQKAKVIDIDAASAMVWVFPLMCASYGVAKMLLTRRYL